MCTILNERETLEAERMSAARADELVQELMAYDRKLAEPFTLDELRTLQEDKGSLKLLYKVLNENEKQLLDRLCPEYREEEKTTEKNTLFSGFTGGRPKSELPPDDLRQLWKSRFVDAPVRYSHQGKIMVWLDGACYGNGKKGVYYVRCQEEFLREFRTTAYYPPKMIVDSKKLSWLEKRYMERKCRETREATGKPASPNHPE